MQRRPSPDCTVTGERHTPVAKLSVQRRFALGAAVAPVPLAIAYGVYWCMEPHRERKRHSLTFHIPYRSRGLAYGWLLPSFAFHQAALTLG